MIDCKHTKLEHGYASNPPKSRCLECGKFFTKAQLMDIKQVKELKHKKEIPTVIEYLGRRYVLDHGNK